MSFPNSRRPALPHATQPAVPTTSSLTIPAYLPSGLASAASRGRHSSNRANTRSITSRPSSARTSCARVAISSATHARLRAAAVRRFGTKASASRLGALILDEYLSIIESAYFGAPRLTTAMHTTASTRSFDAVLFDMDGVLCNSEHASRRAAASALRSLYKIPALPAQFAEFTGRGEEEFLRGVANLHGVTEFNADVAKDEFYQRYLDPAFLLDIKPFPGVQMLVNRVRQMGLKTAVASAAELVKVNANLSAIGIASGSFDHVQASDERLRKKPAPDVFLAAATQLGVPPQRCVVVEDAPAGVQAARAAGMRCVAVSTSVEKSLLEDAGAHVVRDVPGLIEIRDLMGEELVPVTQGDGDGVVVGDEDSAVENEAPQVEIALREERSDTV